MKRNLTLFSAAVGLSLALSELGIYLVAQRGWIKLNTPPTYRYAEPRSSFWGDVNRDFGVWHVGREFRQVRGCFEIVYRANSSGARDRERTNRSSRPRAILLGDSFVEGWGVNDRDRLSNILEERTGYEILNFGTSGRFGPTQYYLLYKTLAKHFEHDLVMVGINPSNDFIDDNPRYANGSRYRPYWQGTYPSYKLIYSLDDIRKSTWHPGYQPPPRNPIEEFKHLLRTYSYTYSAYSTLRNNSGAAQPRSWFNRFNQEEFLRLRYSLEQIRKESGERMLVFTIPTLEDIREYSSRGRTALGNQLTEFARASGVSYVRLLPAFQGYGKVEELFHSCAGNYHWNAAGNRVAANVLEAPVVRLLREAEAEAAQGDARRSPRPAASAPPRVAEPRSDAGRGS